MASANPRAKSNRSKSQREREDLVQGYQHLVREADQIGRRLTDTGFAERAKRKDARDSDAVTKIGPVVARAALEWFSSERGRKLRKRLRALGIQPRGATSTNVQNAFAGKTFVLTCSLERMPRSEAQEIIRSRGGNVTGSVSRKTDFVIAGPGAGSKLTEATALGIKILSEDDFVRLLEEKRPPS